MNSRSEQARKVAVEVAEQIAKAVTSRIGRWIPAWTIVAEASDAFTDSLFAWERTGSPNDLDVVRQKVEALVDAWRRADVRLQIARLDGAPAADPDLAA